MLSTFTSLHSLAKGDPTSINPLFEQKTNQKISTKNSLFFERAQKSITNKAKRKAIDFFDKNPNERQAKFRTEDNYKNFKKVFLKESIKDDKIIGLGTKQKMLTNHHDSVIDLGFSILSETDFTNRLSSYKTIYEILPFHIQEQIDSPNVIEDLNELEYNYTIIYSNIQNFDELPINVDPIIYPANYVQHCEDEIGYQAPMSASGRNDVADNSARCDEVDYDNKGLYINNDYPLKYKTTCIKDQANRGTCMSFATNAAIETQSYVHEGEAYNLSEQFTYFYFEILGGSTNGKAGRYDYGVSAERSLNVLKKEEIKLQLESRWAYNPSFNMSDTMNSNNKWSGSCTNYSGQMCTNRAFQATENEESCGWLCTNFVYTVPERSTQNSETFQITDRNNFWSIVNKEGSLDQAIVYVNAEIPVIVGMDVRAYMFDKASEKNNGYIRYKTENDEVMGGHAMLIIGFVKNADLPAGVTKATQKGFFILKNSWGIDAGDCGYLYLDYALLKKDVTSLHTISTRRPN